MKIKTQFEFEIPDEQMGETVAKALKDNPDFTLVTRCKDCKWFNTSGCAIEIIDDSDKPNENDYCSFAERKLNDEN